MVEPRLVLLPSVYIQEDFMEISVVIPTYNRASLLPAMLEAVLSQTFKPLEIIVIDDGSQDEPPEILQHYSDALRCVRIENSGDLAARNVGTRAARGDLVAYCDSD